ncbi:MAG: hypothetical protein ACPG80_04955, partial [Rickettsiales bacterium]
INFSAMVDEQAINFVWRVLQEFPGYVKVNKLDIEKTGEITEAALKGISRGRIPRLVKGSIEFDWIGVRELIVVEEEVKPAAAPPQDSGRGRGSPRLGGGRNG